MNIDTPYNLELVEDDIDEDEHKKLDATLHQFFPLSEKTIYVYGPIVLYQIAQELGERANKQYLSLPETTALIEHNSDIRAMLLAGSHDGYKLVRRLRMLRKDERPATLPEHTSTEAARDAWKREYCGNHHKIMLKNINSMKRSEEHVNCISLIQSSGTGKSRMVDEMARLVFTIPFNLRNPSEGQQGAYPPEDTDVWNYLCASEVSTVGQGEDRSALFFQNLFSEVNTEVRRVLRKREPVSSEEFAQQWYTYLSERGGENRHWLYERVVHKCKTASISTPPRKSGKLAESRNLLLETLHQYCIFREGNVKILLYFDEAHELGKQVHGDEKKTRYDVLWSSLDKFKTASIFTLFLSTQSLVSLLAPSALAARSSRQRNPKVMWGPITETAFDCHPSFPLRPGLRLADIQKLEFLTRFGRPLFWTMLDGKDDPELLDNMLNLARKKLLFDDHIFAPNHSNIAMAVILDVLITIDYEPRRVDANEREMEMVASHMRIAFSVPNHRMYIRSGYPSEPFLAEAASRQMYHYTHGHPRMVQLLQRDLEHGLIDLSQKGEVGARLLLREAYMKAIITEQKKVGSDTCPNFSAGCGFLGFLEALFAKQFHTSILGCGPANKLAASSGTLHDTFKDAVVRFTHFAKAADSSLITTRGMMMGFLRGAAIMGHNNQEGIDIAIPILLDKNERIKEASMSAFLIQVKRRHRSGSVNAYLIDAKKLNLFPKHSTEDVRPYVTLVAELGVTAPPKSTPNVVIDQNGKRALPRKISKSPKEHPRYSIRAYQCSDKTWDIIHPDDVTHYNQLLCLDELLADHPRQDSESLQLTRQLLPVWYRVPAWMTGEEDRENEDEEYDEDNEDEEDDEGEPSHAMEL